MPDANYHVMPPSQTGMTRLAPARVTAVMPCVLEVQVDGIAVHATLAVAGLYAPVVGDTVLLIEADAGAYVIGVIHATGPMTIRAPADLRLQAPAGTIVLEAARVCMRADEVRLDAGLLHVAADRLRERFRAVRRVVTEALDVDAGSMRTRVRETCALIAKRFHATAEDDVKLDGKRIQLG